MSRAEFAELFGLTELAPGVLGYTVDVDGALYVPLIEAVQPGSGDVGRYLDSLPRDRRVVVPNVMSARLAGMLERRGFTITMEWAPAPFEEWVPVHERPAEPQQPTDTAR